MDLTYTAVHAVQYASMDGPELSSVSSAVSVKCPDFSVRPARHNSDSDSMTNGPRKKYSSEQTMKTAVKIGWPSGPSVNVNVFLSERYGTPEWTKRRPMENVVLQWRTRCHGRRFVHSGVSSKGVHASCCKQAFVAKRSELKVDLRFLL
jgi:hypothetical protein